MFIPTGPRVKVYPEIIIDDLRNDPDVMVVSSNIASTIHRTMTGHSVGKTVHMDKRFLNSKFIYHQIVRQNKVTTIEINVPEFNDYELKKSLPIYEGELTFVNFNEFLYSHEYIQFDEKDEAWFQKYFTYMALKEGLVLHLEYKTKDGKMVVARKEFRKENGDDLIPYFSEIYPSSFKSMDSQSIQSHEHIVIEDKEVTYLKLHHYRQLDLQVYTVVNPPENKVVPAIVVTDMKNNPVEVHCYYKNKQISKEIINELKPNILKENFKADDYFNSRDLEFLDMTII